MIKHEDMVRALAKKGDAILESMTPNKCDYMHHVMGICGEAGELLDAIKKAIIYNKAIDLENVIEELGDIEFYMEGLRQAFDITREQTLNGNITKLAQRYKDFQYTDAQAHARADKQ